MRGWPEVRQAGQKTAAVVVAYRGGTKLQACVERLLALSPDGLDVFVVINQPADEGARRVRALAEGQPRLRVRELECNRGFAGAVNAAVDWVVATGQGLGRCYWAYALVNQDCMVEPGWAGPMLELLATEPGVGLAGAHILEPDGRTVQHAGGRVLDNGLTEHIGRGPPDRPGDRPGPRDAEYVTGALCAVRAEVWTRFGPLDAGFEPVYFEEVDFCMRLRSAGVRIVYVPESRARHSEASSSAGPGSELFLERYHRSRMRFVARHLLGADLLLGTLAAELVWLLRLRTLREIRPVLKAYLGLPRQLLSVRRTAIASLP